MAHMTAHFRGGPWNGAATTKSCSCPRGREIEVEKVIPVAPDKGHYAIDGDVLTVEVFGEFLLDVVYHWVEWVDSDDSAIRGR